MVKENFSRQEIRTLEMQRLKRLQREKSPFLKNYFLRFQQKYFTSEARQMSLI